MAYEIKIMNRAVKDMRKISRPEAVRIARQIEGLRDGLKGDVKKLTNYSPEYRLRVGNWRVLFDVEEESKIVIYRVLQRKDAYR